MKVGIVGAGRWGLRVCLRWRCVARRARSSSSTATAGGSKAPSPTCSTGPCSRPPFPFGPAITPICAALVVITAGANEKAGGATDSSDPADRLRLLATNAAVDRDLVPRIAAAAPEALLLVVTDPPDPLADVARRAAGHERVLSSGTFPDSLRLRFHLGKRLGVDARSVQAQIVGEHGTSQVYLWSTANVAGTPLLPFLLPKGLPAEAFRQQVENEVRYANIDIIEGTGASQLGIGVVTARIVGSSGAMSWPSCPIRKSTA